MNTIKSIFSFLFVAMIAASFTSCKSDDPKPTLTATTFSNLAADPPSGGYNPNNGQPIGVTKKFTFFSFKSGAIVANADSASTKWDVGFNGTGIIVNSGTSGPGTAAAQVVTGIFDELLTAPDAGYLTDNKSVSPAFYAITRGSGNGWYSYNPSTNIITPIAGRVLVFKTADGKYAKMEILNYYKDAPTSPTSSSVDRYYKFRYIYQPDGSKKLSN
ncbi:HmuY family protein [soil metagenome]